jgi:hypothetical protein
MIVPLPGRGIGGSGAGAAAGEADAHRQSGRPGDHHPHQLRLAGDTQTDPGIGPTYTLTVGENGLVGVRPLF